MLNMLNGRFGIEIEFTGITRDRAADIVAEHLNGRVYEGNRVKASDGRTWKITHDASINCQRKSRGTKVSAGREYACELVSPILTYENDIDTIQELVRKLRNAGAFANNSCGIHIHLDGTPHTVKSIKNFINIIASKTTSFTKP